MKKFKISQKIAVAVLSTVMLASVATSFAFWVNDIADASNSADLSVSIGTGNTVTATLTLGGASATDADKVLIPGDLAAGYPFDQNSETKEISFVFPIIWLTDTESAVQHEGKLQVALARILSPDSPYDLKSEAGLHGNPLIGVSIAFSPDNAQYAGGGNLSAGGVVSNSIFTDADTSAANPSLYARVTVNLTEPVNQEQYAAIAGKALNIELDFIVTAESIVTG